MKRDVWIEIFIAIIALLLSLISCEKRDFKLAAKVKTSEVSSITDSSAEVLGNIIDIGSGITDHGHCWSQSPNPTIADFKTSLGEFVKVGSFASNLKDLKPKTHYYVKSYINNASRTLYGEEIDFTTIEILVPTLTTTEVSFHNTYVQSGGNIISNGGSPVSARGVCWSTLPHPTVSDSHTDEGSGVGTFFSLIYGYPELIRNTTYYIRAFAANSAGTGYGNEVSFISKPDLSAVPVIRNVNVRHTEPINGSLSLVWKRPDKLDTIPANGPYEYLIYRSEDLTGFSFSLVKAIQTANLADTVFVDTLLNTQSKGYMYKIELYNNQIGNRFLMGDPCFASSLYLEIIPGDSKALLTITGDDPWFNSRYDIFRLNETTMKYDSIGTTNQLNFTDANLKNGTQYCYYVRSTGRYLDQNLPVNLVNLSEIYCTTPISFP